MAFTKSPSTAMSFRHRMASWRTPVNSRSLSLLARPSIKGASHFKVHHVISMSLHRLHTVTLTNQGATFVDIDFVRLFILPLLISLCLDYSTKHCRRRRRATQRHYRPGHRPCICLFPSRRLGDQPPKSRHIFRQHWPVCIPLFVVCRTQPFVSGTASPGAFMTYTFQVGPSVISFVPFDRLSGQAATKYIRIIP